MNKSDTAHSSSTHLARFINIFTAIDSVECLLRSTVFFIHLIISTVVVCDSVFETTDE